MKRRTFLKYLGLSGAGTVASVVALKVKTEPSEILDTTKKRTLHTGRSLWYISWGEDGIKKIKHVY